MTKWKKECNTFIYENAFGKVLDIGCGKYPYPNTTTVDIDDTFNPDVVADVNINIPLPDQSFDCIILNNVLEHLHDPQTALQECRRVLKNGGCLLVAVPFLIKIHQEPRDYLRYTRYMLEILFKDFKEVEITESNVSLTEQYRAIQRNLFGQIRKKRRFGFLPLTKLILSLSVFLPEIHHERFIQGYLVKAKK